MDQTEVPPGMPRPIETFGALALRTPGGYYLARGITWRPTATSSVFLAETWATHAEFDTWLSQRVSSFRRTITAGDWRLVRLTTLVHEVAPDSEARPIVAEAAGYQ